MEDHTPPREKEGKEQAQQQPQQQQQGLGLKGLSPLLAKEHRRISNCSTSSSSPGGQQPPSISQQQEQYKRRHNQQQQPQEPQPRKQQEETLRSPMQVTEGGVAAAALDFFSGEFNAEIALKAPGLQPPNPKVKPLDNLAQCRRILPQVRLCSRPRQLVIDPTNTLH